MWKVSHRKKLHPLFLTRNSRLLLRHDGWWLKNGRAGNLSSGWWLNSSSPTGVKFNLSCFFNLGLFFNAVVECAWLGGHVMLSPLLFDVTVRRKTSWVNSLKDTVQPQSRFTVTMVSWHQACKQFVLSWIVFVMDVLYVGLLLHLSGVLTCSFQMSHLRVFYTVW